MTAFQETMSVVSPNLLYAVLVLSLWLTVTAIYVPGTGAVEAGAGVGLLISVLAVIGLPVQLGGIVLLGGSLGCFLALLFFRHQPALTVAGMLLQLLGGVFLFPFGEGVTVPVLLIVNAAALAYYQIVLRPALLAQDADSPLDADSLIGQVVLVADTIDPEGLVRVRGETWRAHSNHLIEARQWARVTGRTGLQLEVEPAEPPDEAPG